MICKFQQCPQLTNSYQLFVWRVSGLVNPEDGEDFLNPFKVHPNKEVDNCGNSVDTGP